MTALSYSITEYVNKFKHEELIPIVGEPIVQSLLNLFDKVKCNTQCIPTTLGGGQLGYLGLILDDEGYCHRQVLVLG